MIPMPQHLLRAIVYIVACLYVFVPKLSAQVIDVYGGGVVWLPTNSFADVSGIPSPQSIRFDGTSSVSTTTIGIGTNLYTLGNITFGLGLSYTPITMMYAAEERAPIALQGGGLYIATLRHDIDAKFNIVSVAPRAQYKPLSWFTLQTSLSLNVVGDPRYTQVMRFTDPVGLPFVDGQLEQITGRGKIANARIIVPSLAVHALADVPMNASRTIMLQPRVGYQQALVSMTTDGAFMMAGLDASLGIRIAFNEAPTDTMRVPIQPDTMYPVSLATDTMNRAPESIETVFARDTVVELCLSIQTTSTDLQSVVVDTVTDNQRTYRRVRETYRTVLPKPPSVLRGSVSLQFVDEDGGITDKAKLRATRVAAKRQVPIVPFIVFDTLSSDIPDRYIQLAPEKASSFQERALLATKEHWHYQLLNIVGSRMRSQKLSTCTLQLYVPCADTALGNARMLAVQSYLESRFGVRSSRITIVPPYMGLVEKDTSVVAGSVVISDPTGKLLLPLEGQVRIVEARLPTVQITPDAISEVGITTWSIVIRQGASEIASIPDSTSELHDVTINLNDVMLADGAMKTPVSFVLHLQDAEGTTTQSEPVSMQLTSKVLRPSERATELHRSEILRIARSTPIQQQTTVTSRQRVIGVPAWVTTGLQATEVGLYEQGAKVYIQEERKP